MRRSATRGALAPGGAKVNRRARHRIEADMARDRLRGRPVEAVVEESGTGAVDGHAEPGRNAGHALQRGRWVERLCVVRPRPVPPTSIRALPEASTAAQNAGLVHEMELKPRFGSIKLAFDHLPSRYYRTSPRLGDDGVKVRCRARDRGPRGADRDPRRPDRPVVNKGGGVVEESDADTEVGAGARDRAEQTGEPARSTTSR